MDVTVTVRHCEVPERFRRHLEEKVSKVQQLSPRARRVSAVVSHESNPRLAPVAYCIELTVHGDDPVVRAEASADEPYAALDLAFAKIAERLRRIHDRRTVRHGRGPDSPADTADTSRLSTTLPLAAMSGAVANVEGHVIPAPGEAVEHEWADGTSPISIREKTHQAEPMHLEQALYEMELVGHDFFLFVDAECGLPSVVYRRKGWSYGVIRLASNVAAPAEREMALAD
jgi:ribosomal subunit interface protein